MKAHEMRKSEGSRFQLEICDDDIYEAMKQIPGYLDITPADFGEIYRCAYRHALDRISKSVRALDLMTKNVFAVQKDTPVRDVAEVMAENGISGVPVINGEKQVIGIISEKDFCSNMGDRHAKSLMGVIANCLKNQGCFAMTIREKRAEDIMTSPVITVSTDATLMEVTNALKENNINRIPVVDAQGCLAGIISRADIVRFSI